MMDGEEQENELLAMESILDSSKIKFEGKLGHLKIDPVLYNQSIELRLMVPSSDDFVQSSKTTINQCSVQHLPPFTLNITFPSDYPSVNPPEFTLSCVWLSRQQLNKLCLQLDEIWKIDVGNVVLYNWYQFLQNDALDHLNISCYLEIRSNLEKNISSNPHGEKSSTNLQKYQRAVQDVTSTYEILPLLLAYNQGKVKEKFESSVFSCKVCLEEKLGTKCTEFKGCKHIYCKECLAAYFKVNITEGNVNNLNCPEPTCQTSPLPNQVKELVDSALYKRYERLLLQTTLDTMTDVTYCPLAHCQSPVIMEAEEKIAQCPSCCYAFCPFCKLVYHGISNCKIASGEIKKLCQEYESADKEKKKYMEKKYGFKALRKAIDESETEKWMKDNAKSCPCCGANIEKKDGCNKMTCTKCRAYFCWLCLRLLSTANPYKHFNDTSTKCYNRLFEGVVMDDDDEWLYVSLKLCLISLCTGMGNSFILFVAHCLQNRLV